MTIQQITVEQLPALSGLAESFYSSSAVLSAAPFQLEKFVEMWRELIALERGVIFLLMDREQPVGAFGGILHLEQYSDKPIASEFFWFVQEEARGRGILLMREFEKWARERGAREFRMIHLADSMPERLKDFYLRDGFHVVETAYAKELV
jgi:GNAT superfamily N-acetyltransferase